MPEPYAQGDLERVETRIQFLREDYRMLTHQIAGHLQARSALETELRKLKGWASRIKMMQVLEDFR